MEATLCTDYLLISTVLHFTDELRLVAERVTEPKARFIAKESKSVRRSLTHRTTYKS